MKYEEIDIGKLAPIIEEYKNEKWPLIPLLQRVQDELGYIPAETIEPIAKELDLFPSEVQGVITFYSQFSLEPRGKYIIRVCKGTACHVRGGRSILKIVKRELGLEEGQTTEDYQFTLETVACLGACFLAPTMVVNQNYYGKLSPPKINSIIKQYDK
ncbi:MAG: NADH-quinone oxidoreductase subunit NuoE [Spirochaetota bacterium]|nr:NADH-quinone oxidoreductase subunit NuoE [Spirochaetota bacterium]